MAQYLISTFQPRGDPPPAAILEPIMDAIDKLNAELRAADAWVFAGGLEPPEQATTLRPDPGGHVVVGGGPHDQGGGEYLGGFWIISAPNLDIALSWARKAALATTLPVELRAFRHR
jgi:hypothetical protein